MNSSIRYSLRNTITKDLLRRLNGHNYQTQPPNWDGSGSSHGYVLVYKFSKDCTFSTNASMNHIQNQTPSHHKIGL